mmetsp:Transcript_168068/g.539710  ORF Transcript_168068/g.539710 Transcript_168068/m.539710 type:complete len:236 (-) Transcript_168068:28-735(-)
MCGALGGVPRDHFDGVAGGRHRELEGLQRRLALLLHLRDVGLPLTAERMVLDLDAARPVQDAEVPRPAVGARATALREGPLEVAELLLRRIARLLDLRRQTLDDELVHLFGAAHGACRIEELLLVAARDEVQHLVLQVMQRPGHQALIKTCVNHGLVLENGLHRCRVHLPPAGRSRRRRSLRLLAHRGPKPAAAHPQRADGAGGLPLSGDADGHGQRSRDPLHLPGKPTYQRGVR